MTCDEKIHGSVLVISPAGRIDSRTAKDFQDTLLHKVESHGGAILIDCSALAFISSAGLRVLLMAAKRLKAQCRGFGLSGVRDTIEEVLRVSGFDRMLPMWPDEAAALAALD